MKKFILFCILFFILALINCAKAPAPTGYPYSQQQTMQSVHHWDVLAENIADKTDKYFQDNNLKKTGINLTSNNNSSFSKAFETFLTTRLLNYGFIINKDSNIELRWDLQIVKHRSERNNEQQPFQNTSLAVLATGIYEIMRSSGPFFPKAAAIGITLDLLTEDAKQQLMNIPHNEVIISIAYFDSGKKFKQITNVFYIQDEDKFNYSIKNDSRSAKTFNVKGNSHE